MQETLMPEEITSISGTVQKITYRNETNCYTVASLKTGKETVTVVGMLPFVNEGDALELNGKFTVHPTYGSQFAAQSFEKRTPENAGAILKYLSAGAIKGIGPATAVKLVERFGEKTLDIIPEM